MLKNTLKKQTEIKQTALRFIAAFLVFAWRAPCLLVRKTAASAREDHLFYLTFAQFMI